MFVIAEDLPQGRRIRATMVEIRDSIGIRSNSPLTGLLIRRRLVE